MIEARIDFNSGLGSAIVHVGHMPIHNRMPVIYDKAMGRQWLEGPFGGRAMALDLVLQALPSERMEAHEVSTLVNSPENDTAGCIQPVSPGEPLKPQLSLL